MSGPEYDQLRQRCKQDLKFFYKEVLLHGNEAYQKTLGKFHDFIFDFLRWDELSSLPKSCRHSPLYKYIPKPDEEGEYPEVWLYWPTLASEPQIQHGPTGPLTEMFNEKFWKGLLVRLVGDGSDKCLMAPRGHLKSEIGNKSLTLQDIIRDPSQRIMMRTANPRLADDVLSDLKFPFDNSDVFKELFGYLGPPGRNDVERRNLAWSRTEIQVRLDTAFDTKPKRGKEPTLRALGIDSAVTGGHCEKIVLDDIVDEKNSETDTQREKVRLHVQRLQAVRDPGSRQLNIGTVWAEDDAHSLFIRPGGGLYESTSFLIGTLRDAEDNPIWPEHFTEKRIKAKRRAILDDYVWFCQYFNNPYAASAQSFDSNWIEQRTLGDVRALAGRQDLDLFLTIDPASTTEKKSDWSAAMVQGQTQDGNTIYVLDGFRDKMTPDKLPERIVELIEKWHRIAVRKKLTFKVGIETHAFQLYLKQAVENALRRLNIWVPIEELKHNQRRKVDRIKRLAGPYSAGCVIWPDEIIYRSQYSGRDCNLVSDLRNEFTKFPRAAHDDVLDAQAYGLGMMRPVDPGDDPDEPEPDMPANDIFTRAMALKEADAKERPEGARGRYLPGKDQGRLPSSRVRGQVRGRHTGIRG